MGVLIVLVAFAWFCLGARSRVQVRNGDAKDIVSCMVRVESELDFDQVHTFGRIPAGSSVAFQTRRLDESSFVITCRYADGRVFRGSTTNVWDPQPGDTTWIELRESDFVVDDPNRNQTGPHDWDPMR